MAAFMAPPQENRFIVLQGDISSLSRGNCDIYTSFAPPAYGGQDSFRGVLCDAV